MAHKRSETGKQRQEKRATKRNIVYSLKVKIQKEAKRDPIWAETICMTSHTELRNFGLELYKEFFCMAYIPDVDNGFVLSDSRGRGAFQ